MSEGGRESQLVSEREREADTHTKKTDRQSEGGRGGSNERRGRGREKQEALIDRVHLIELHCRALIAP